MPMIDPGRTNVVPRTMIALCVGLFLLRAGVIYYGTFFQPASESMVAWQKPVPSDKSCKDLLSTPTLYFFCDTSDLKNQVMTQIVENMLFHNREVAALIKEKAIPIKVVLNGENSDALSKSLKNSLRVTTTPTVCLALPNGRRVDQTAWQSDRMFVAFLQDALKRQNRVAAYEAMRRSDWALASHGWELDLKNKARDARVDFYNTMYWSFCLRHQHDEAAARNVLEDSLRRNKKVFSFDNDDDNWPEPCVHYLLGEISDKELVETAEKSKEKHVFRNETAHYVCGMNLLFQGKTELAKKELRVIAEDRGARYLYSAKFARAELRALGENFPEKDDEDDDSYY